MNFTQLLILFCKFLFVFLVTNEAKAGPSTLPPCPTQYVVNKSIFGDGPDERWHNCFGETTFEGMKFTGEFQNGHPNGQGLIENLSANIYFLGFWKKNKFDGQGIAFDKNGKIEYSGLFEKNKFIREENVNYEQFDERLSKTYTNIVRRNNKELWINYFQSNSSSAPSKLAKEFSECMKTGFLYYRMISNSEEWPVEKPDSRKGRQLEQRCVKFLNSEELQIEKLFSKKYECKINNISSECRYAFVTDIDKRNDFIEIPLTEIYKYAFDQASWKVISVETNDGKSSRSLTEETIAIKEKEEAKKEKLIAEAAEKDRQWRESPEYKNKIAEETAKKMAIAESEVKKLKIKGYGLGPQTPPCTPKEVIYSNIANQPVRLANQCSIGNNSDKIYFIFDSSNKNIINITRIQFDNRPDDIIEAAIKFYGKPNLQRGRIVLYGNAHTISYLSISSNDSGFGLGIEVNLCPRSSDITKPGSGIDGLWREGCGSIANQYIRYELIDAKAYSTSVIEGTAKLQNQRRNSKDF